MSEFIKYQHVERLNSQECEGLLEGVCHIFYKLDGTNASVWWSDKKGIQTGSRNRLLSEENDNAGFCNWVYNNIDIIAFYSDPSLRRYHLYGEWLVPHTLRSYRDDAWKRFYVFDVLDTETGQMLSYEAYSVLCEEHGLDYIPPLAIIKNPNHEDLYRLLENSGQFLVKDGEGKGEGIVIKNYNYTNKYGCQTWAKIVTNEFKEANHKAFGAPSVHGSLLIEERIVQEFLTEEFIKKEQAKIILNHNNEYYNDGHGVHPDAFDNKWIPELLGRCYYEFLREESYNFVKQFKNPTVNYRLLNNLVIKKVKETIGL